VTDAAQTTEGAEEAKRLIIVADDEPHIGRIIKMKLEQGPFDVTLAFDGQEAVEAIEQSPRVDLVLLDLMMPKLSGLDVLERVRRDPRYKDVPCIILTAAGQEHQYRAAMERGATEFLTKPFSPKKLYALVAQLTGVVDEGHGAQ
jgi:two-component system, OmpR family, alkaline phosphatase synthesis response regulator PhoP